MPLLIVPSEGIIDPSMMLSMSQFGDSMAGGQNQLIELLKQAQLPVYLINVQIFALIALANPDPPINLFYSQNMVSSLVFSHIPQQESRDSKYTLGSKFLLGELNLDRIPNQEPHSPTFRRYRFTSNFLINSYPNILVVGIALATYLILYVLQR